MRHLNKNNVQIITIIKGEIEGKPRKKKPQTPNIKQISGDNGVRTYMDYKSINN